MRSSCSQSYIRAKTLWQNEIDWEGNTVVLRWKSMAIRGDEDQRVQKTCFVVVDEDMANQAGLRVDILVGRDHGLPLSERSRTPTVEKRSSDDSSISGSTDNLAAQSSKHLHNDTGRRSPLPVSPRTSQPQIVMFMFNGPDANLNCVSLYRSLRQEPFGGPLESERVVGSPVDPQMPASATRWSSYSTGNHSRNGGNQVASRGRRWWRRR